MKFIVTLFVAIFWSGFSYAKDYLITDFGAKSDGVTLCTQGIQSAINKAWKDGGGRVVIPKGEFVSGTVF